MAQAAGFGAYPGQVRSHRCAGSGARGVAHPDLPIAAHDEVSRELKLLVDRREDLVGQRTSTINRLRQRIHELDPPPIPSRRRCIEKGPARCWAHWLDTQTGTVGRAGPRRTDRRHPPQPTLSTPRRCASANASARWPRRCWPCPAAAELTAAKLVGETAGVTRFKSEPAFARHSGVAPVPVWSGNTAGPGPAHPIRQPPTQRRPTPHRHHSDPPRRQPRPHLLPQAPRRRKLNQRSTALPKTSTGPHRLPAPPHRRPNPRQPGQPTAA